ncbi:competence protein ComK [Mammaliicoccus stepanovicii]|uniref:Competence transcription factor ComK n=1 Tax=Mammaliicoccus stepanovicii TaxID=643214 RepID=A0A239ZRY5_9STAP|nr:competence protein ComK [Mammaliicoccus stepanovicii]PNZ72171.1 hypothetical protein CD111_11395 [Mammaliicoccus stepanovicii]GGI38763.1 hypothetical protein GCM10010896_00010 [Mammaliicoccus stepanovicii]SNV73699.1 competence transcription factor ComK [Mammaliicoccus stepanovicii]
MERYIIKQNTIYLKAVKFNEHIVHTEVSEAGKDTFIIEQRPQEIMNQSCRFYGEHIQERKLFTKRLTNISSKPPILISPITSTYFFCTHSERSIENSWINLLYVRNIVELKGNKSKIQFEEERSIEVPISFHILNHQYLNCTCLHYKNHRNKIFINNLNKDQSPFDLDLKQEGYSVLDVIKMYLKDKH